MGKNARTFGQDLMRGEGLTWTGAATEFDHYRVKEGTRETTEVSGTSIFDPVLCELVYRWFCPKGGAVLDPFAGGSVRGIVAAKLGLCYTGIDLSERQIEENRKQAQEICSDNQPAWIVGDSRQAADIAPGDYDLIFSCPPYGNLEIYSDDERDLSTLDHKDFIAAYREIIGQCVAMLKPDRFACFVVGDFRDSKGFYRNFVSDTIAAFEAAGAYLYNEAVLVTAVGSLPIRIGKQFGRYRKLGKTHQNVLVFYNGEPKAIPDVLGECDFGEADESSEER
jgi:DNA modification methylase